MCKDFSKDYCNSTFLTFFLGWNLAVNFWLAIHTAMSRKDYASANWHQLNLRPQILGSLKKKSTLSCLQTTIWMRCSICSFYWMQTRAPNSVRRGSFLVLSKSAGTGSWTNSLLHFLFVARSLHGLHTQLLYFVQNTTSHILEYTGVKFKSNHLFMF